MVKARGSKYYAVRKGRGGPKIYDTWAEAKAKTQGFSGAEHKSFKSRKDAEEYLGSYINLPTAQAEAGARERLRQISNTLNTNMISDSHETQVQRSIPATPSPLSSPSMSPELQIFDLPLSSTQIHSIILSSEQEAVLKMVNDGRSVFFTGSAGTGKSILLREIIKQCRRRDSWDRKSLAITASTGIASVNIGGVTLHSWAGIGLGKEDVVVLYGKILGSKKVYARWKRVKTLIIDEISMIDGKLFDKLEQLARMLRDDKAPFGGIQLVLSGDFCQLPPIGEKYGNISVKPTFAFDAESWSRCIEEPVTLTHVFRQKDQVFVNMLNSMRFGRLDTTTIKQFYSLSRPVVYTDGIEPTDLFPKRDEVDAANSFRLNALQGKCEKYQAIDRQGYDENHFLVSLERMQSLLKPLIAPQELVLKVGAQVMLIKNLIQGELVNGSVGKVVAFSTPSDALEQGLELAQPKKDPASDDKDEDDFEDDASETPLEILQSKDVWPVVEFGQGMRYLCVRASFEVNNPDGKVEATREQVPLILAWALSIHKSQGQTLERVRVNLGQVFEKGQAYVALSRATSMETLQVLNFDPAKVVAHPRVLEWMKNRNNPDQIEDDLEFWHEA